MAKKKGKYINCSICGVPFYVTLWRIKRKNKPQFCSKNCHSNSGVFTRKGLKNSLIHNKKISERAKERVRKGIHNLWKGGITNKLVSIRFSMEYKLWRKSVFERDNYTCIWCGKKGIRLNADHIKPFALFPELRFAIDNGRTLCEPCHKTTDTFGGKARNKKP